jgi:hypothetical protein
MLAVSLVGRYLVSTNVAALLVYFTAKAKSVSIWADLVAVLLILISNIVLWSPIKSELYQVECFRRRFGKEKVDAWDGSEEGDAQAEINLNQLAQ